MAGCTPTPRGINETSLSVEEVLSPNFGFEQNPKIGCQKFNDLQTPKFPKKPIFHRTPTAPHMNIVAIAQQKGGVGKTTSALALGHALAEQGKRALLVDLDPQSSLTISLGLNPTSLGKTVYDLLREEEKPLEATAVITKTPIDRLDLIPANIDLAGAETELVGQLNREGILRDALAPLKGSCDYILIDCPPSLGLLTTNALTAATHVLIPIQSDYLAMRGTTLLLETIGRIQRKLNPRLKVWRILITMHNVRTVHAKEVLEEIRSTFKDVVFTTPIKYSVRAKEAPVEGQSILTYDPLSEVARAYRSLARELISHG
jgi:chromosome partitioning protein